MKLLKLTLAFWLLLAAAAQASSQTPAVSATEGEWISYRDAYRAMLWFDKYGKPKHLIQNHFQLLPDQRSIAPESLRLTLVGKSMRLQLPLDASGRTALPLLKAAYDDNAELVLNQKVGRYQFRARVSIMLRADGVYEAADLRAACEQVLAYQNYLGAAQARGKRCVGVRFSYPKKMREVLVELRKTDSSVLALAQADGSVFADEARDGFRIVTYLFASWPEKSQIITHSAPLAIAALYE